MAENRPTKVLKIGGIEVAKWEKQTKDGKTMASYSFQKTYKDNNTDEWKHTSFFNLTDLPILASLILLTVGKSAKVIAPQPAQPQIEGNTVPQESEDVPF